MYYLGSKEKYSKIISTLKDKTKNRHFLYWNKL